MPKIIKFGGDLTKFSQKQVRSFLAYPVEYHVVGLSYSLCCCWFSVPK